MAQITTQELPEQEEDALKSKYLIFFMGNVQYGLEIRYITEIIGVQPITDVPDMPEYIKGVTNLRGKIIPVMDARLRFKKETREYDDRTCIIVLNTGRISIGLIVDSIAEVLTINDTDIVPPPEIGKKGSGYLMGVGKTGGDIKLLLDCQKLLSDDEMETIGAMA